MKTVRLLPLLAIWAASITHAQDATCPKAVVSINRPVAEYPSPEQARPYLAGTSYLHVFVEGTVVAEFTVNRDGSVSSERIVESNYKLIGRNASRYKNGYFNGFLEMNVLPAVKTLRFAPIAEPCTGRFTYTWRFEDSEQKEESA